MSLSPIKKVLGETTNWPNRKMVKVEKVSSNGNTYEATISPKELELIKLLNYFKKKYQISNGEVNLLRDMIEEYGQDQYSLGSDEVQLED
jgi:sulfur relay (sulfurtransferase) DsrC/TusE family protein